MSVKRNYGGLIWTDHALERLGKRGFTQEMAWYTWKFPDEELQGKMPDSYEFRKRVGESTVTVIAKQNDKKEWVILSAWVYPPLTKWARRKEEDYQNFKKAGFWGKLWYTVKRQIFG